ncbi:MAG: hypothetical protein V2I33_12015 [Kangiellaceae bacterium]|jgi:ATP/ADP translocase|nr:hypothetical protein [Kangiellaceae bacterium]
MEKRLGPLEVFLSLFTRMRPNEGKMTLALIVNAYFILFSHYLLKVVRESLLLTHGSAVDKSLANALSAIVIAGVVFLYTEFYLRPAKK